MTSTTLKVNNTPYAPLKGLSNRFLVISGHDFRSKRKANLHFIADALAKRGPTRFFSVGFSLLSKIKRDPRLSLWERSNRVETWNGVETYLWRTLLHPVNLHTGVLSPVSSAWFRTYARSAPETFRRWIKDADTIIIESGMGVIFVELIKTINPAAHLIYIASDDLDTIGCSPFLSEELARVAPMFNGIGIPSVKLVSTFPPGSLLNLIPHGMDHTIKDAQVPSPYHQGINLVSVGSMLFDRSFFEIACKAVPEATFHVIGGGRDAEGLSAPNLVLYGEMPFQDTIAYIKHANAGLAPYVSDRVAPYLVATSMKLMQYGFLGIPAVCPHVVTGGYTGRFGYVPGDADSIAAAIRAAVARGHVPPSSCFTWSEVTDRILNPTAYADTRVN